MGRGEKSGGMKKTRVILVGVLVAATVAAGVLPAEAGRQRARSVTVSYTGPSCFYVASVCWGVLNTAASVGRAQDENRVSIEIIDSSGQMVGAAIGQGPGGKGFEVCGSTERPLKLSPTGVLYVNPYVGLCGQEVSLPTTGEIVLTFFRD